MTPTRRQAISLVLATLDREVADLKHRMAIEGGYPLLVSLRKLIAKREQFEKLLTDGFMGCGQATDPVFDDSPANANHLAP